MNSVTTSERSRDRFRLWFLLGVLAVENSAIVQLRHPWFNLYIYRGVPLVFGLALLFFGRTRLRRERLFGAPLDPLWIVLHLVALFALASLEAFLFLTPDKVAAGYRLAVWLWLALLPVLVFSLLRVFLTSVRLIGVGRLLGSAWAYAAVCTGLLIWLRERMRLAWDVPHYGLTHALQTAAFWQTRFVLGLFYPDVIADPQQHLLGTDRFTVTISGTCSGVEGLALISVLMLVWFVFARHELRLTRAALLVPVALAMMWVLNIARIAMLFAIGESGHPVVAINGFHSEAGWIAFIGVSLLFLIAAQRSPWFRTDGSRGESSSAVRARWVRNVPAIYLTPFLAITAASLLSTLVAGRFEWLYPLRFLAAALAIYVYRAEYRRLNWSFGMLGPLAGLAVGAIWIALHAWVARSGSAGAHIDALAIGLDRLSPGQRSAWVLVRVLAAVLTVPIAEELAFRGFLARRLMAPRIESVPFSRLSVLSIAGSAVLFGLMHGRMWLAGILAGVVFALVAKRTGRLGEAVAAHASANLVIAAVVLVRGNYALW